LVGGKEDLVFNTPKGRVYIRVKASPDFIASLELDEGMGIFSGPNYPREREKKALIRLASKEDTIIIIAYNEEGKIVGFIAVAPPSEAERWSKLKDRGLIEAMAIEVSSNWRSLNIANKMMDAVMDEEFFDDKIVICTGYSWHWDLDDLGISKEKYRNMLLKYLERAGFYYYDTDEPNVNLDPANFFTARVGPKVSKELYDAFEKLLFRDSSWAELKGRPRSIREELQRWKAAQEIEDSSPSQPVK
jgi:ribosomal protein S18 acetylase RimI-like enzyme